MTDEKVKGLDNNEMRDFEIDDGVMVYNPALMKSIVRGCARKDCGVVEM